MTHQLVLIAALVLNQYQSLLTVSEASSSPIQNQPPNSNTTSKSANRNSPGPFIPPTLQDLTYTVDTQHAPANIYQQGKKNPDDSRPQKGIVIANLSLILSVLALAVCVWAAISAHRSADGSTKSANAAVLSGQAYMGIEDISESHTADVSCFCVEWRNFGRSPAILKRLYAEYVRENPSNAPHRDNWPWMPLKDMKLGPDQKCTFATLYIPLSERDRIASGGEGYIYTRIDFRDVFSKTDQFEEAVYIVTGANRIANIREALKDPEKCRCTHLFDMAPVSWKSTPETGTRQKQPD